MGKNIKERGEAGIDTGKGPFRSIPGKAGEEKGTTFFSYIGRGRTVYLGWAEVQTDW